MVIDDEPWMVGKDIASALGYAKPENAIAAHVDDEDKTTTLIQGTGSNYKSKAILINESGLYSLVLSSKLPNAKKFRRWVTSEVLPSIRKHGGYIAGQDSMSDEELLARAVLMAQSKIEEKDREIANLKAKAELDAPKVAFADAVHNTESGITVEKFVKLLFDEKGVCIGRNKMFQLLRSLGYLRDNNMPYQKYLESGYFTTCEVLRNGMPFVVTLITGKGQTKLFSKIQNYV